MSSSADEYSVALETVYKAVRDYAKPELDGLIRLAIYRMRRIPAVGIYGDDYVYKTQWDEYCHEVQEGPFDIPDELNLSPAIAWDMIISGIVDYLIQGIPQHAAVLLSTFAVWELDENIDLLGSFWPDGISQVLKAGLAEQAGARRLFRFGPYRDG